MENKIRSDKMKDNLNLGNEQSIKIDKNIKKQEKIIDNYILEKVIGRGTFGVVYLAKHKETGQCFAIKRYFMNLHPNICQMEISILSYLNKKLPEENNGVLKIYNGFNIQSELYLVLSYQKHQKFQDFYMDISLTDLKKYMYNLLSCLEKIHKCGIVHRDLKPDNFLYDLENHSCLLIDFGLSEYEMEETIYVTSINFGINPGLSIGKNKLNINKNIGSSLNNSLSNNMGHNFNNNFPMNSSGSNILIEDEDLKIIIELQKATGLRHRIGTRGFLAPEIIFNAKNQNKAVDIWAAGVIFLSFLTKRMPVFNLNKFSSIKDDTIKEILPLIYVYGKDKIEEIARKYQNGIYMPENLNKLSFEKDLEFLIVRTDIPEEGIDLLRRMMDLDQDRRISAEQAKKHNFFADIDN